MIGGGESHCRDSTSVYSFRADALSGGQRIKPKSLADDFFPTFGAMILSHDVLSLPRITVH